MHMKALATILARPPMPMGRGGEVGHEVREILQICSTELDHAMVSI